MYLLEKNFWKVWYLIKFNLKPSMSTLLNMQFLWNAFWSWSWLISMDWIFFCFWVVHQAEFSCQICRKVMVHPITTPCAHNFCKACLEGAFAGQSLTRQRGQGRRALRVQKNVMKCPSCPIDIADFLQNPQVPHASITCILIWNSILVAKLQGFFVLFHFPILFSTRFSGSHGISFENTGSFLDRWIGSWWVS